MFLTVLFFELLILNSFNWQQTEYEKIIANKMCGCMENLNQIEAVEHKISGYSICVEMIYAENIDLTIEELNKLESTFPDKDVEALELEISRKVLQELVENCESFQNLTKVNLNKKEQVTPALVEVGNILCKCTEDMLDQGYSDPNSMDMCLNLIYSQDAQEVIRKEIDPNDYEESTDFGNRLGRYLMTYCSTYLNWYLEYNLQQRWREQ